MLLRTILVTNKVQDDGKGTAYIVDDHVKGGAPIQSIAGSIRGCDVQSLFIICREGRRHRAFRHSGIHSRIRAFSHSAP